MFHMSALIILAASMVDNGSIYYYFKAQATDTNKVNNLYRKSKQTKSLYQNKQSVDAGVNDVPVESIFSLANLQ